MADNQTTTDPCLDSEGVIRTDVIDHVRNHARQAKAANWAVNSNPWVNTRLENYWHDAWCENGN